MPQPTNQSSPAVGKADPVAEVRARLKAIEQRVGAAKDAAALAEVRRELAELASQLGKVSKRADTPTGAAWPADLNAAAAADAVWGADPPEVARG